MAECKHKFVHLNTWPQQKDSGYCSTWTVIEEFFCEKCLKLEYRTTHEYQGRETPIWWRTFK